MDAGGRLLHIARAFVSWATHAARRGAQVALVVTTSMVCYEVVMRYFFHKPTSWSVDYSSLLNAMIGYLGLAYVTKIDGHISVTLLVERLSERRRSLISFFTNILALLLTSVLAWQLWGFFVRSYHRQLLSQATGVSLWWFMLVMIICLGVMVLQFVTKICGNARSAWSKHEIIAKTDHT